ncbi:MAG: uroporphyrinogen-III synthase, partial [Alphaproteobacteria bacterium]|nr:uroporphyrinogen-III synthase [Alphaproteobacteria bacterium]
MQQALLEIEPVVDAELGDGPWAAVLFTSANAVRAVSNHRRFKAVAGLPACTVGKRTMAAAIAAGFAPVTSADGDVNALAELMVSLCQSSIRPGLQQATPPLGPDSHFNADLPVL